MHLPEMRFSADLHIQGIFKNFFKKFKHSDPMYQGKELVNPLTSLEFGNKTNEFEHMGQLNLINKIIWNYRML